MASHSTRAIDTVARLRKLTTVAAQRRTPVRSRRPFRQTRIQLFIECNTNWCVIVSSLE